VVTKLDIAAGSTRLATSRPERGSTLAYSRAGTGWPECLNYLISSPGKDGQTL
jgi:hypothetical protein